MPRRISIFKFISLKLLTFLSEKLLVNIDFDLLHWLDLIDSAGSFMIVVCYKEKKPNDKKISIKISNFI